MKEHGILMSQWSMQRYLAGAKTQTRRPLKKQPLDILPMNIPNRWVTLETRDPNHGCVIRCRYGVPGDVLWFRETWAPMCRVADPFCECDEESAKVHHYTEYRADTGNPYPGDWPAENKDDEGCPRWRPSIFMPRWAARVVVPLLSVRVERVQDISNEDAIAEGVIVGGPDIEGHMRYRAHEETSFVSPDYTWHFNPRDAYQEIWDEINAKRGLSWQSNPFCWVLSFPRYDSTAPKA